MALRTGMLWYDDTPGRPFDAKIELAVKYYLAKYGSAPTVCYVHPATLPNQVATRQTLAVFAAQDILPYHFWLGVANTQEAAPRHEG